MFPQIGIELAYEGGMGLQQSAPRRLSAPARQRLLDQPVDESSHITQWGMFLHMQQVTA